MTPKIRNIIIFVAIGVILVLIYFFFFSSSTPQGSLVTSTTLPDVTGGSTSTTSTTNGVPSTAGDFLTLLLNVQNIKLNDAIFSDPAWNNLHDSSIELIPDNTEGRPNPFAQFGNDVPTMPYIPSTPPSTPTTPSVTPPPASAPTAPTTPATTKPTTKP